MKGRGHPRLGILLLLTVLLSAWPMHQFQVRLHDLRSTMTADDAIRYVPSGKFLSVVVLGYDNLVADILWIRGIALFGEQFQRTQDVKWYDWLYQLIDLATELDPLDVTIYKYGGLMLRVEGIRVDQSSMIFHKGMQHLPEEYFLPFGIAMNYMEFKNDIRSAGQFMQIAAMCADAPFYLRNLAASFMDQSQQKQAALLFLEEQLQMLEPGSLRYRSVEVKMSEVKHDDDAQQIQRALTDYMSIYHRCPADLDALKGRTWIGPWPEDPYGGHYVIDKPSGRILSSNYYETRARIRKELGLGASTSDEQPPSGPQPKL